MNFWPSLYLKHTTSCPSQMIDVLVDTGSSNMLVPATTTLCEECEDVEVTQRLNLTSARAQLVACEDTTCIGDCSQERLDRAYEIGPFKDGLYCGPNGGVCTYVERFPDALELNANGLRDPIKNVCLFRDRYGDGSYASGFLVESQVDIAGSKVKGMYGAITVASDGFYEAPQVRAERHAH